MTADASEFNVGSGVKIEVAMGVGLESAGDRKEVQDQDTNGISCSVDEDKFGGRTGLPIALQNKNLEDPADKDLDLKGDIDPVPVGDQKPGLVKGENGEFSMENGNHQGEDACPVIKLAITVADDCNGSNAVDDAEGGVIESDSGATVTDEGSADEYERKMEYEIVDEKERYTARGISEENGEICKQVAYLKLSLENGHVHAESNVSLETSQVDLSAEAVENKEGKPSVKDIKFEKENGHVHAECNVSVEPSKPYLVVEVEEKQEGETLEKDTQIEKELDSTVEVEKNLDSQIAAIDEQADLGSSVYDDEKQELKSVVTDQQEASKPSGLEDHKKELDSTVEVEKNLDSQIAAIDGQADLGSSVSDDEKQEPKSVVTDQQEASKPSGLEDHKKELETVCNNTGDKEEKTTNLVEGIHEIVTSITGADSQTHIDALVDETKEPQAVITTSNELDHQQFAVCEGQVTENTEQAVVELTTEVELEEEPQTSLVKFVNQDELTSAVEVEKQDPEILVTKILTTECSREQDCNGSCSLPLDECLDENVIVPIADSRTSLQPGDGIKSSQTALLTSDVDIVVSDAGENGYPIMTGDSVCIEYSNDLHPSEDSRSSIVPAVTAKEVSMEPPLSTIVPSDTNDRSDSCVDATSSELESPISEVADLPSPTEDVPDKSSNGVLTHSREIAVDDADAIKLEQKKSQESYTSLNSSTEVKLSLDVDENKAKHADQENIQDTHIAVKDPSASTLNGEKVEKTLGKPQAFYIIRIPRFIDDQLSTKVQIAQSDVNDKTQCRDSVKIAIEKQKAICSEFWKKFEAARAEERSARAAVVAKRQQMDSVQLMINKLKSVHSIEELDGKIQSMEFDLQHETIPLKEEKKYIHELKQLRQQRDQLALNMGSKTEIDEAVDQKEQIDEQFKVLRKELDSLRSEVLRTESNANIAKKKYDEEQQVLKGLQQQFRDADALRQKAYGQWRELRSMLIEKNKHFNLYKSDQRSAENYISSRDFEGLRLHCSKQVETVMALWDNDEEFRNQYVQSNLNSTLRRLRTSDGRSLGPDEEPPVLRTNQFKISGFPSELAKTSDSVAAVASEAQVETSKAVESFPALPSATKSQPVPRKKPVKLSSDKTEEAVVLFLERETENEKVNIQSKEEEELRKKEEELAKKEDELRKEKAAVELKEQYRLEQIAKAKEADERKKRQAEKAQARAEYRAQKEAEAREKKRAKKQKKRSASAEETTSSTVEEIAAPSGENTPRTAEELVAAATAPSKRPLRSVAAPKYTKVQPIPLPLRNKGRRKMATWMWVLLTVVVVLLLFLAGNCISFSSLSFQNHGF